MVGVELVGALRALVGLVAAVVAVGCRCAPGVVVGGQELVLVGALPHKHIRDCLFLSLNSPHFSTIMTFILLVFYYSMVLAPWGGRDGTVFSHFYTNHMTNSNL